MKEKYSNLFISCRNIRYIQIPESLDVGKTMENYV